MPTTADVKSLLTGVVEGNWQRVIDTSDRIAKKLKKQGHKEDATWIEETIAKRDMPQYLKIANDTAFYHVTHPQTSLDDLIVPDHLKEQISQVFKEYKQRQLLREHGLNNINKILLIGNPGTGKTMTAEILAHGLDLPLKTVRQENLITSLMGKTANNLSIIMPSYDDDGTFPAVYFFDEFDTLASKRITASHSTDREYNEITNVLLKEMDHINPDCFFVAASNLSDGFDPAVFRRFDMCIKFPDTTANIVSKLLSNELKDIAPAYIPSSLLARNLLQLPPSLIKAIALDAKKSYFLDNEKITDDLIKKVAKNKYGFKPSNNKKKKHVNQVDELLQRFPRSE